MSKSETGRQGQSPPLYDIGGVWGLCKPHAVNTALCGLTPGMTDRDWAFRRSLKETVAATALKGPSGRTTWARLTLTQDSTFRRRKSLRIPKPCLVARVKSGRGANERRWIPSSRMASTILHERQILSCGPKSQMRGNIAANPRLRQRPSWESARSRRTYTRCQFMLRARDRI